MFNKINFNSIHRLCPQNKSFPWPRRSSQSGLTLSRCTVSIFKRHSIHDPCCHGIGNCFTLIWSTHTPSCFFSKDILSLFLVVTGQVNYVHLDKIHQNTSLLSSKDIIPVVTGQVNYVYLDEIHTEPLVSLFRRHLPRCHGTGKLCSPWWDPRRIRRISPQKTIPLCPNLYTGRFHLKTSEIRLFLKTIVFPKR